MTARDELQDNAATLDERTHPKNSFGRVDTASDSIANRWHALASSVRIRGPLPIGFRVGRADDGRPVVRVSLTTRDKADGQSKSFGKTYVLSDEPHLSELLYLAMLAYFHELCEWFYVDGAQWLDVHPEAMSPTGIPSDTLLTIFDGLDFSTVGREFIPSLPLAEHATRCPEEDASLATSNR